MTLFVPAQLDLEDNDVLEQIHARRERLSEILRIPKRWEGLLRRNLMARAVQGSNSIEGYVVETDDAAAALEGLEPLSADERAFAEVRGYQQALQYVLTLAGDATASIDAGTLKSLHFMMLSHDLEKSPGQFRQAQIYVRREETGDVVYEGPDSDDVEYLIGELITSLSMDEDPLVAGAMAHLNLVMIHPFRDGNGRMARALQTLVLARRGIGEPTFSSVEEWLGANTLDYYRALAHTGGGAWHPERDTSLWLKFNLRAHHMQSLTLERRIRRSELLWEQLDAVITAKGLPERTFDALFNAAIGYRIRRGNYAAQVDVQGQTATRDLAMLTHSGLLEARGEKRGRHYVAGKALKDIFSEVTAGIDIPMTEPYPNFAARLAADVRHGK